MNLSTIPKMNVQTSKAPQIITFGKLIYGLLYHHIWLEIQSFGKRKAHILFNEMGGPTNVK